MCHAKEGRGKSQIPDEPNLEMAHDMVSGVESVPEIPAGPDLSADASGWLINKRHTIETASAIAHRQTVKRTIR
jgi:hypothetical protein